MHRKGIGSIVAIVIILFIIFFVELVIFSQHVYHGEQQIRALSEAELLSESSKLETWVRSYQKAAELGYVQSIFDSGYGSILLPYEFEWNYYITHNYPYLPYWQIYDTPLDLCFKSESENKFECPFEIFENYFKQKISLISRNYLKNYLNDYEDLSSKEYKIDFYGNVNPQVLEIKDDYILIKNSEPLNFKRTFEDTLGNEINITRSTYLTSKIYTSFGKAIKKAIEILENDFIGKCFRREICSYNDENGLKSSLANLAKTFSEKDLNVSFELENFASGIVEVRIEDNSSSYLRYNFPRNLMDESFLGLDFLVRAGSTQAYQFIAKNLDIFRNCPNSNLGILALKSDICNYFQESLVPAEDEDEGDPYLKGKCGDSSGSYEDICFDSMLYEYKPFSNSKVCYFEKIKCSECSDGRCKPSSCLDSDGLDYFTKGNVSYDGRVREDKCYSEDMVTEYYCSDGYVSFDRHKCPQGCYCQNGACNLPDACKQLRDIILENYGKTCYDEDYNPVADINKDGIVEGLDLTICARNICNESWCSEMLSNTSNPCKPSYCKQLRDIILENFWKTCYDEDYNPVADINKDGIVEGLDLIICAKNICNESWCSEMLSNTSNPCI